MTDKNNKHTFKRNDYIDLALNLRIKKGLSRTSILANLIDEVGLSKSYSYKLIQDASKEFNDRCQIAFKNDIEEDIERFEVMLEQCLKLKNYKESNNILKEICKLKGHYVNKIDMTTGGDKINPIVINIIKPDDRDKL